MPKTKISEFSATPGNNTDIDGINIAEGCAPSGINDAIRELMAQLKDFQAGTAGDSFNGPVGTTTAAAGAFTTLSASSTVSGAGFSTYLASPPAIGGTAAAAGSFTTLTTSSTVTHNGGTANGVAYLNGSKVLTTGSALTFDGTNLGVPAEVYRTTASSYLRLSGGDGAGSGANVIAFGQSHATAPGRLSLSSVGTGDIISNTISGTHIYQISGTEQMRLTSTGLGIGTSSPSVKLTVAGSTKIGLGVASNSATLMVNNLSGSATGIQLFQDGVESWVMGMPASSAALTWANSGTEQMRLTSTGLGIGTSSPGSLWSGANKLVVGSGSAAAGLTIYTSTSTAGTLAFGDGTTGSDPYVGYVQYTHTDNTMSLGTSGTTKATLDSSGNLGLGVTPSAWSSTQRALQIGNTASVYNASSGAFVGNNFYNDSTPTSRYLTTNFATAYAQSSSGQHQWYTAPSGTAGNTISFTQAMTLDASGNLGVGTTIPASYGKLAVNGNAALNTNGQLKFYNSGNSNWSYIDNPSTDATAFLRFAIGTGEAARITSGGELLVGTTATTAGARLSVKGVDSTSSNYCMYFENSSSSLVLAVQNDGRWRSGTAASSPYNYVVGATNRDLYVDNAGNIGYVSSVRSSKTNIAPVSNAEWLLQLNPVTFNFRKKDTDGNYTEEADGPLKHGLIAEEVEAINPDMCFYDDTEHGGALRGVNYSSLITPMIKLLQEQQVMINELKAEVAALKAK